MSSLCMNALICSCVSTPTAALQCVHTILTSALSGECELPEAGGMLLQVRYLKVIEKSGYQALPWVRYITTGGEYEIRMA